MFNKKFKNCVYFFTCILPDYMAHGIPKEIWKNSHFENMTAGFLHRCQNRLRRNTPEIIHFQTWQKLIFTNIAPWQLLFSLNVVCNVSKWYSDHFWGPWHTQKSIFASMNQYFNNKLSLFHTEASFDNSEEKFQVFKFISFNILSTFSDLFKDSIRKYISYYIVMTNKKECFPISKFSP